MSFMAPAVSATLIHEGAVAAGTGAMTLAAGGVAASSALSTTLQIAQAAAPVAATIAGTLATNKEQAQVANTTADVLEYNKAVAEEDATAALRAGAVEELKLDRQKKLVLSTQKSNYSASGFTLSGTPLAIMADTAAQFELDKSIVRSNARTIADRYRSQGRIYGMQAGAQRTKADNSSSLTSALLTGVTSASKYFSSYGRNYGDYYSSL